MNQRERVLAAVNFHPPDKVPFWFPMTTVAESRLSEATGGRHPIFTEGDSQVLVCRANVKRRIAADRFQDIFGDDWGQQHGLQMGPAHWRAFIRPRIARMYARVRAAGKYVFIHCCGKVEELFDDLVELGLNIFNPFQPEVMDVYALHAAYFGRLAFNGGVSTQRLLPFGSPHEVRTEVARMLHDLGARGGLVVAPAHDVPPDVPVENMLAMLDVLMNQ